jgi:hypothetical protein
VVQDQAPLVPLVVVVVQAQQKQEVVAEVD